MEERIVCWIDEIENEVDEINLDDDVIITKDGNEYRLFQCREDAEAAVRDYWNEMSDEYLIAIIGAKEMLRMLRLGESLDDWIEALDVEDELAHYDGLEHTFESEHEELSAYELAYRTQ